MKKRSFLLLITSENLLLLITMISIFIIRGIFVFAKDFPLNDGGMFYATVEDILREWPQIPSVLSFNNQDIPFAYPPFAFFFTAALHKLTGIPLIHFFHYLPYVVSSLSVLVFYYFSVLFTKKKNISLLSTWVFGITPISYEWMIMGGGLTRSFGVLFTLLAFCTYFLWQRSGKKHFLWLLGIFWGLTGISHLQWVVFTTYSLVVHYFFYPQKLSKKDLLLLFFPAGLVILPWLLWVFSSHGWDPYLSAASTNTDARHTFIFRKLFDEQYFQVVGFLGALSLIITIIRKELMFLIWVILIVLFNSRGSGPHLIIPFAIFISQFLFYVMGLMKKLVQSRFRNISFNFSLIVLIVTLMMSNVFFGYQIQDLEYRALSSTDRRAMEWAKDHTESTATFLIISPYRQWFMDHVSEWFPAIADRQSVLTVQGMEWTNQFLMMKELNVELQQCQTFICVETLVHKQGIKFRYVYISRSDQRFFKEYPQRVYDEIGEDSSYERIFEEKLVSIWRIDP